MTQLEKWKHPNYKKNIGIIAEQTRILIANKVDRIKIKCGNCGKEINLFYSFRCFECKIIFCKKCAEEHFKIS